ncbi:MAG: hypothetical protein ABI863_09690 [Ginsengibacter sp.]
MWTKIVTEEDFKKMKLNTRLLKFTGKGIPKDPPLTDPAYSPYSLQQNTGGNLNLKSSGHNPLFSSSFVAADGNVLNKTASQMIEEGVWWY